jgi:hypothetical protein
LRQRRNVKLPKNNMRIPEDSRAKDKDVQVAGCSNFPVS